MTTQPQRVTRRRFLGALAATAGGGMRLGRSSLGADAGAPQPEFPSTGHFWYRLQPAGRYVDSQRGNKAFGYAEEQIVLSEDNGRTWPHRLPFADAQRIPFSHILKNGEGWFRADLRAGWIQQAEVLFIKPR